MPKKFIKPISLLLCFCFFFTQTGLAQLLPQPLLVPLQLPVLRYLSVNTANPSNYFNFLLDRGQRTEDGGQRIELNQEAKKLIHYFFLGITLPSEAFWVNLKPQEPERITSEELSKTDLGRTLLEQDLKLKKDMAKYLHPHNPQGKLYWEKLYQALEHEGRKASATNRGGPAKNNGWKKATITSSNRVWIVPAEAVVLETEDGALVARAQLKVLLESEYLSLKEKRWNKEVEAKSEVRDEIKHISESLMKEIILPALTKEINESPGYAPLRQVYHSLILAEWFKRKQSGSRLEVLGSRKSPEPNTYNLAPNNPYSKYINSGTTTGLESELPWEKQAIWQEYLKSYQEGEYKLQDTIFGLKRMYFSGGIVIAFNGDSGSSPLTSITPKELSNNPDLLKDLNIPKNPGKELVVADTDNKDNLGDVKISVISFGKEPEKQEAPGLPDTSSIRNQPQPRASLPSTAPPIRGEAKGAYLTLPGFEIKRFDSMEEILSIIKPLYTKYREGEELTFARAREILQANITLDELEVLDNKIEEEVRSRLKQSNNLGYGEIHKQVTIEMAKQEGKYGVDVPTLYKGVTMDKIIKMIFDSGGYVLAGTEGWIWFIESPGSALSYPASVMKEDRWKDIFCLEFDAFRLTELVEWNLSRDNGWRTRDPVPLNALTNRNKLKLMKKVELYYKSQNKDFTDDLKNKIASVIDLDLKETKQSVASPVVEESGSASTERGRSASSAVMLTYFKSKLAGLGLTIEGLDETNPVPLADRKIGDTQWYLFEMPSNKYLELFIKDNDYVAYGLTTLLPQNTILRFHSFEKGAGKAGDWAEIYKQRIEALRRTFAATGKNLGLIGVPTDQVLSEAQLVKRVRTFLISKGHNNNTLEDTVKDLSFSIINKVRLGIALSDVESQMVEFKDLPKDEYHSFGPAADLYVNKLKFTIVPTMAAPNKFQWTAKEMSLLDELRTGKHLSEIDLIELFSGRGLVQIASSPMVNPNAENLPDSTDKTSQLFESSDTIEAFGHALGKATFGGSIGSLAGNRKQIRNDMEDMRQRISDEINKLLAKGLAQWKVVVDASILVPGDIVRYTWKSGRKIVVRYSHSNPQTSLNLMTRERDIIGAFHFYTSLEEGEASTYSAFTLDDIKDGRIEVLASFERNASLTGIKFMSKEEVYRLVKERKAGWVPLEDVSELRPGDIILEASAEGEQLYRFEETVQSALKRLYGHDTGKSKELFVFDMNLSIDRTIKIDEMKRFQRLVRNVTGTQDLKQITSAGSPAVAKPASSAVESNKTVNKAKIEETEIGQKTAVIDSKAIEEVKQKLIKISVLEAEIKTLKEQRESLRKIFSKELVSEGYKRLGEELGLGVDEINIIFSKSIFDKERENADRLMDKIRMEVKRDSTPFEQKKEIQEINYRIDNLQTAIATMRNDLDTLSKSLGAPTENLQKSIIDFWNKRGNQNYPTFTSELEKIRLLKTEVVLPGRDDNDWKIIAIIIDEANSLALILPRKESLWWSDYSKQISDFQPWFKIREKESPNLWIKSVLSLPKAIKIHGEWKLIGGRGEVSIKEASSPAVQSASSAVGNQITENRVQGTDLTRETSITETGGIDLSQIELTLKDDKYISSLNPADIKILRAAKALKEEWNSLSLLYIHELMLLLLDDLASEIQNKNLLSQVLQQLQSQKFLDPQAIQFLNFIQANKPLQEIRLMP